MGVRVCRASHRADALARPASLSRWPIPPGGKHAHWALGLSHLRPGDGAGAWHGALGFSPRPRA